MKKLVIVILSVLILFSGEKVFAQDEVYSLNKYNEEELNYIISNDNSLIVAGTIKDDNKKVIIINYSKTGEINWKYIYKKSQDISTSGITYTYKDNTINGYLLVINSIEDNSFFLNIDLDGKLIEEKELSLGTNIKVEKIIEEQNHNYIIIGQKENHAFIAKYNQELDLVWIKENQDENTTLKDIIYIDNDAYYGVLETLIEQDNYYRIIKYDLNGNAINEISINFEKTLEPHLEKLLDSYIIYGMTKEVKLNNNKVGSYYLIKYTSNDDEEWETIGNIQVDNPSILKIKTIIKNEELKNIIITLDNNSDKSIETIKLDNEGNVQEKIKKLKNNYYKINDYLLLNNTLYYVGQINCPDDDNCDYKDNSLLLISSEDKVIEVKDKDSKNIIVIFVIVITFGLIIYTVKKKHLLKKK